MWVTPPLGFTIRGTANRTALDRFGIYPDAKFLKVGQLFPWASGADRNRLTKSQRLRLRIISLSRSDQIARYRAELSPAARGDSGS